MHIFSLSKHVVRIATASGFGRPWSDCDFHSTRVFKSNINAKRLSSVINSGINDTVSTRGTRFTFELEHAGLEIAMLELRFVYRIPIRYGAAGRMDGRLPAFGRDILPPSSWWKSI
jgi:hypothetical protein